MNAIVENMEALVVEASTLKGWKWVHEQPLWATWPLEKFGMAILIVDGLAFSVSPCSQPDRGDPDSVPPIPTFPYRSCGRVSKPFKLIRD